MGDYRAISDIGKTLKKLLEDNLKKDPEDQVEINFESPKEIKPDEITTNMVSIFLYQTG